ncbi:MULTISPECIES: hypothetical protein [unclassified Curtobacterium]|uniref:hypothetical protein n=1 Tax=unclassified Curtobacterium TaxID=257496 RepID=UPI0008DDBE27|nr:MULTISPECIES: hypothetical protein [unclassified Curtobacterium]OIH99877.1 hypothetical protein BIU92_03170 [Curtobacterium sp. MCBA15_003]OII14420.1 hypothetical protein BIU97_16595 [Curtobacterium sp. MCBA15_009]OII32709.1 hypothetical protein BIU94_16350 [Curtobacterium sp. MMLR14_006]
MNADLRAASRTLTAVVLAVPGVRSVVPPGPALATLVRDVRTALDTPRDGAAVLVRQGDDGSVVRVVVTVDRGLPTTAVLREVRDAVRTTVVDVLGGPPAHLTVRAVEID